MTDKELFEKTEKAFKLKEKNNLVDKVFNEGKFKQTLLEKETSSGTGTSPIGSNYGANTVSAARAAGRGALGAAELAGKGIGATAKGLRKFGNFLRGVIPGTNTNKRKKAETRKQLAQAKAEELKNKQLQQQMMFGGGAGSQTSGGKTTSGGTTTPGSRDEAEKVRIQADQYNINILTQRGGWKKTSELKRKINDAIAKGVKPAKAKTHQEFRNAYPSAYGATTKIDQSQNMSMHAADGSIINVGDVKKNDTASPTTTNAPNVKTDNTIKTSSNTDVGGDTNTTDFKVGDIIRFKNTRGKESQGKITNLEDPNKPGILTIKASNNNLYPISKKQIIGKVNESYQYSFEYIVKKYR